MKNQYILEGSNNKTKKQRFYSSLRIYLFAKCYFHFMDGA